MSRLLAVLLAAAALGLGNPAAAAPSKEVVVLTSFPKEIFEASKQAFEQKASRRQGDRQAAADEPGRDISSRDSSPAGG